MMPSHRESWVLLRSVVGGSEFCRSNILHRNLSKLGRLRTIRIWATRALVCSHLTMTSHDVQAKGQMLMLAMAILLLSARRAGRKSFEDSSNPSLAHYASLSSHIYRSSTSNAGSRFHCSISRSVLNTFRPIA